MLPPLLPIGGEGPCAAAMGDAAPGLHAAGMVPGREFFRGSFAGDAGGASAVFVIGTLIAKRQWNDGMRQRRSMQQRCISAA
jgi:hypothetical protein